MSSFFEDETVEIAHEGGLTSRARRCIGHKVIGCSGCYLRSLEEWGVEHAKFLKEKREREISRLAEAGGFTERQAEWLLDNVIKRFEEEDEK